MAGSGFCSAALRETFLGLLAVKCEIRLDKIIHTALSKTFLYCFSLLLMTMALYEEGCWSNITGFQKQRIAGARNLVGNIECEELIEVQQ